MIKRSAVTEAGKTAFLVKEYVREIAAECYDPEDEMPFLYMAIGQEEWCVAVNALGIALLEKHESTADAQFRYGGDCYDPRLAKIAERLNWPQ
jgi:hypothetical protein